jgi:hypothetical protein
LLPFFAFLPFGIEILACKKPWAAPPADAQPLLKPLGATATINGAKTGNETEPGSARILEELVDLIAERSRFPLAQAEAEERLRPWGPIKREEQEPNNVLPPTLVLSGNRGPILNYRVEYDWDEGRSWKFSFFTASIVDPSGRLPPTYRILLRMIRKRLGKPAWTKPEEGRLTTVAWNLRHRIELSLSEEVDYPAGGPQNDHLTISISEPQGDPD